MIFNAEICLHHSRKITRVNLFLREENMGPVSNLSATC
jgi:hypothetical protein